MRTLYVHCGLHKTGTTSLQNALATFAPALRAAGLLFPATGRPQGHGGHHNIAWQIARDRRYMEGAGSVGDLAAEMAAFDGDVVLSSEDFESSLLHTENWLSFAKSMSGAGVQVKFVIYLRDALSYIESIYVELVGNGMADEYSLWARDALQYGRARVLDWEFCFDYDKIAASMQRVPNTSTTFRSYNDLVGGSIVSDFLSLVGDHIGQSVSIDDRKDNTRRSINSLLVHFIMNRSTTFANRKTDISAQAVRQLTAEVLGGLSPRLVVPDRLRAAVSTRLKSHIFSGGQGDGPKFVEASRPDFAPPIDTRAKLVNIARVFSFETYLMFLRILDAQEEGRASVDWKVSQIATWWGWVSDLS